MLDQFFTVVPPGSCCPSKQLVVNGSNTGVTEAKSDLECYHHRISDKKFKTQAVAQDLFLVDMVGKGSSIALLAVMAVVASE